jgi:hypothetical protein
MEAALMIKTYSLILIDQKGPLWLTNKQILA